MITAFSLGTRDLPIWARTRDVDAIPRIADTLDDRAVHVQMSRSKSAIGSVSRASPVQTGMRNCTRDEGGPLGAGGQALASNRCKLLSSKAMVVSVAEKSVLTSSNLLSTLHRRFTCVRLPASCLPGSCPDFSATLTTIAFDDSSLQWLGACS